MSKRKALPTTEIINAFNNLSTEQKEFVFDYIRSQASRPKPITKSSSKKRGDVTELHKTSGVVVGSSNENPSPRATSAGASGGD